MLPTYEHVWQLASDTRVLALMPATTVQARSRELRHADIYNANHPVAPRLGRALFVVVVRAHG